MKYITHNQDDLIDTNGTHFLGNINLPFDSIAAALGQPMRGDFDKVKAEWNIQFDDGLVATIYDWKEYDREPEQVTDWHIGGKNQLVVQRVYNILKGVVL
jgi:hypothetical protein